MGSTVREHPIDPAPFCAWCESRLAHPTGRDSIGSEAAVVTVKQLAAELGIDVTLLYSWRFKVNALERDEVAEALHRAGVGMWEIYPDAYPQTPTRQTHRWCLACRENSAVNADLLCLWCGGPTEAERPKPRRRRRGRKPGRSSLYTEAQLRALHVFHIRDGLSINELAKRTYEKAGYKTHGSASSAISKQWKELGLQARDRIAATVAASTKHGLAPKHGPRPGYGTYKRKVIRGEADNPQCAGVRMQYPRKGEPCQHRAMDGSEYCLAHDPDRRVEVVERAASMRAQIGAAA